MFEFQIYLVCDVTKSSNIPKIQFGVVRTKSNPIGKDNTSNPTVAKKCTGKDNKRVKRRSDATQAVKSNQTPIAIGKHQEKRFQVRELHRFRAAGPKSAHKTKLFSK